MKGSAPLWEEFIQAFNATENASGTDNFKFTPEHEAWFASKGCEWVHPDLGPGDAVFWDSRQAHYGAAPTAGKPRMAVCKCRPPQVASELSLRRVVKTWNFTRAKAVL